MRADLLSHSGRMLRERTLYVHRNTVVMHVCRMPNVSRAVGDDTQPCMMGEVEVVILPPLVLLAPTPHLSAYQHM